MQFGGAAVLLDHALERGDLQVSGVAGPLQDLEVQHRGDVFHGGAGQHLAGQIQHHHGGWQALRHGAQQRLRLRLVQPVLQVLQERGAVDLALVIEGQAQVLGERALARTVEAGHPDADFVLATRFHGQLHAVQQLAELLFDALGDDVFRDLGLEAVFLRRTVGDDLLDVAEDVLARVEERTNVHCSFPGVLCGLSRQRGRTGSCHPLGRSPGT